MRHLCKNWKTAQTFAPLMYFSCTLWSIVRDIVYISAKCPTLLISRASCIQCRYEWLYVTCDMTCDTQLTYVYVIHQHCHYLQWFQVQWHYHLSHIVFNFFHDTCLLTHSFNKYGDRLLDCAVITHDNIRDKKYRICANAIYSFVLKFTFRFFVK